jgi:hypothetical protein
LVDQVVVSPHRIETALAVLPSGQPMVVALDATRLGPWEVWLAGIVVAGRTLPIGWAVIPYPWPQGRFRTTTLALIQRLQLAFPSGVRWRLVADRGCPSAMRFAQLRQGETDCSVQRRLRDWVTVADVYAMGTGHLAAGRLVVVSTAVATPPPHKQNPGTARERAKRATAPAQHRAHKQGRKTTPPSATAQRSAQTWVLFTSAPTVTQAVAEYARRMSIEETFRDWPSGWSVRAAVVDLPTDTMVDRLIGVVCLTYSLQMPLGQRLSLAPRGQQRRAQWTVTDRVRWFWCGQQLFNDPGHDWSAWVVAQWEALLAPQVPAAPESEAALIPRLTKAA